MTTRIVSIPSDFERTYTKSCVELEVAIEVLLVIDENILPIGMYHGLAHDVVPAFSSNFEAPSASTFFFNKF